MILVLVNYNNPDLDVLLTGFMRFILELQYSTLYNEAMVGLNSHLLALMYPIVLLK